MLENDQNKRQTTSGVQKKGYYYLEMIWEGLKKFRKIFEFDPFRQHCFGQYMWFWAKMGPNFGQE